MMITPVTHLPWLMAMVPMAATLIAAHDLNMICA